MPSMAELMADPALRNMYVPHYSAFISTRYLLTIVFSAQQFGAGSSGGA